MCSSSYASMLLGPGWAVARHRDDAELPECSCGLHAAWREGSGAHLRRVSTRRELATDASVGLKRPLVVGASVAFDGRLRLLDLVSRGVLGARLGHLEARNRGSDSDGTGDRPRQQACLIVCLLCVPPHGPVSPSWLANMGQDFNHGASVVAAVGPDASIVRTGVGRAACVEAAGPGAKPLSQNMSAALGIATAAGRGRGLWEPSTAEHMSALRPVSEWLRSAAARVRRFLESIAPCQAPWSDGARVGQRRAPAQRDARAPTGKGGLLCTSHGRPMAAGCFACIFASPGAGEGISGCFCSSAKTSNVQSRMAWL